jgi:predicted secreted hydrolase
MKGRTWLDREWSSSLLPPDAAGWDWTGVNFDDGAALMAFQVRARDGRAIHAGGTLRRPTKHSWCSHPPSNVGFRR